MKPIAINSRKWIAELRSADSDKHAKYVFNFRAALDPAAVNAIFPENSKEISGTFLNHNSSEVTTVSFVESDKTLTS